MKYIRYKYMMKFILTLFFASIGFWAYSIPFTGGDLSYKRLKQGVYEFTLVLERDCGRYAVNPEFAQKVTIGAFNLRNEILGECGEDGKIFLSLKSVTKKIDNLSSGCIETDESECREVAIYKGTANVPISTYGYQFVYSDCCRPNNIKNFLDPGNTGFTLISTLTLNGYLWFTSLPVFKNPVPLYSCIGEENIINPEIPAQKHEEYRFSLCEPYTGVTPKNPLLMPKAPPYDHIKYKNGYSAQKPLGTDGMVSINQNTGVITYSSESAGSYMIAVCIEQYKKGRLVGTSIKEIQVNFTDCSEQQLDADFEYIVDFCNIGRVSFENRSFGATSFKWTFHTDENTSSTSTNPNPVMTFPSAGNYLVELAVVDINGCVDTARKVIEVYDFVEDIQVVNFGNCNNLEQILSLNKEVRNYNVSWYLVGDNGTESIIGTGSEISHIFPSEGLFTIRVEAEAQGCIVSATRTIQVVQGVTPLRDTIVLCSPDMVALNPGFFDRYNYKWKIDSLITDKNAPNPMVFVSVTTLFPVTISDKEDPLCSAEGFVLVIVDKSPVADFRVIQDLCADGFVANFVPVTAGLLNIKWTFNIGGDKIESTEESPTITFPATGYYEVSLSSETVDGCSATQIRLIEIFDPATDLSILNFGNCINFEQVLKLNKNIEGFGITWFIVEGGNETQIGTGQQITYDFGAEGNFTVRAKVSNPECTVVVENILVVVPGVFVPRDTIDICLGGNVTLNPVSYEGYTYRWLNGDLIEDVHNPSPVVNITETTRFEVIVTDANDPTCVDTGFVLVRINELPVGDFVAVQDLCADSFSVAFQPVIKGLINIKWTFLIGGETIIRTDENPVIDFPATGYYEVSFSGETVQGCTGTSKRLIEVFDPASDLSILNFGNCINYEQVLKLNKNVEGFGITWFVVDGGIETEIGTGQQITYDFGAEGNYTVRAKVSNPECTIVAENILSVLLGVTVPMDTIDLCLGGNVTLNPVSYDGYTYRWLNGDLIEDVNNPSPIVNITETTRFEVVVTDTNDPNCVDTGFVLIRINAFPVADFVAVQDLCADGFSVAFRPVLEGLINIKWTFVIGGETIERTEENPVIDFPGIGYYEVGFSGETVQGCTGTSSRLIEVFDPASDLSILNFGNCINYEQVLKLNKNIEGFEITWNLLDGENETEIGTGQQITYDFGAEGIYTVRAEVSNPECTIVVENILSVILGVTVPQDTIDLCVGGTAILNPVPYEGYVYQWLNGELIEDVNNPSPIVHVTETTRFEVIVTDANDSTCVDTGFVLVRINALPVADFEAVQDLCAEDFIIAFRPVTEGLVNIKWTFLIGGKIIERTEENPIIEFPATGYYEVSLSGETVQGCNGTSKRLIEVFDPATDLRILNFGNCENYEQVLKLNKNIDGFDIAWALIDGDNETAIGTGQQITYDFGAEGSYTVRAKVSNPECTIVVENVLTVILGVTVPQDTIDLCLGGDVTLNPVSYEGYIYQWLNGELIEDINNPSPIVNVTETTRFEVVVTDANDPNCVDTGFVWVRINEIPFADFNAVYDICDVDKTMVFEPVSKELVRTTWFFDGDDASKTSTLKRPSFTYDAFGSYEVTLIAESVQGCIDTVRKTVVVNDLFAILDFTTYGGCDNLDYKLTLNNPAIGYNVNWYLDDSGSLAGIGQGTTLDYTFDAPGRYDIRVELANAECARSFVRTVQITDGIEAPDTSILVCDPGLISLNPFGRNDLTYSWTPAELLDDPTSFNPLADISASVDFQVTVELQDGDSVCSATGTVRITLDESTDSIAFDTTTLTICEGDLVFLNEDGDSTLLYYWQPESFFEDARIANPSTRLYTSQEFVVTITDPVSKCSMSFGKRVNVIPIDDLIDIDYSFICGETKATLIALDVPLDADIEWTYNDSVISTETTFEYDFEKFGTFEVTARILGEDCIESSALITLIDPNEFLFRDTIYLCEASTILLNPDGDTNLIYTWIGPNLESNNIASPTAFVEMNSIYNAIVQHPDDTTCQTTGRVYVYIEMASDIITSNQSDFCMGDTARLSVGNGGEPMNIQWSDPDGILIGSEQTVEFVFEKMGEYTVIADISGCTFMDTIQLGFRNTEIIASKTEGICPGDEVALVMQFATEEPFDSIIWSPSNVVVSETDPTMATYTPDSNTIVTAWVYFSDGCLTMDTVMLRIPPALNNLTISTDRDTLIRGQKATLTASDAGFASYRWEPADFVDNPNQSQTEVIPETTTTFTLTAVDANGCAVVKTITIVVINPQCAPPYIFVPRAFTPNGDGKNDILYVRGESIDEVEFIVYDRWGSKMFETNSLDRGWDGTFQGKQLPPDVYGYYLNVLCIGGDTYEERGNVTIIR